MPNPVTFLEQKGNHNIRLNLFLEEAMAEEAAARWREQHNDAIAEHHDDLCQFLGSPGRPSLPFRYVDTQGGYTPTPEHYSFSSSAYCAEGMRLIADRTGVDIFQLMIDSRSPDLGADARRQIIHAIETVEKGLYAKLRDLPYGPEPFVQGYELIRQAVTAYDTKTRTLGKLAAA